MSSPNLAKKLAANLLATRVLVRHDAVARAQDRNPEARANARNAVVADVNAAAGRGDAADAVDGGGLLAAVAEDDGQRARTFAFADANVVHEAFELEHAPHLLLELGVRHLDAVVA